MSGQIKGTSLLVKDAAQRRMRKFLSDGLESNNKRAGWSKSVFIEEPPPTAMRLKRAVIH